jgi:hypothetical protein
MAAAQAALDRCSHAGERYLFEVAALLAGLKKVVRVQMENDAEYAALSHFASLTGLYIAHSPTRMKVAWTNSLGDTFLTSVPWDDPEGTSYAAYLAQRSQDAAQAAEVESKGTAEEIGHLLGYSRCCCVAYERLENGEFWAPVLSEHSPAAHYAPWANRYAYLLYGASLFPDYFPCSLGCEGTQRLAQRVYDLAQATSLNDLADQYLALMRRPIILGHGFILGVPQGADAAQGRHPEPVLHEWISGSSQGLPDQEDVAKAVRSCEESLQLGNGVAARIIYFDR